MKNENFLFTNLIPLIKGEMKSLGIDQKTLANKAGLRESIVSKFLNAKNDVSINSLNKIALGLEQSLLYLIERSDSVHKKVKVTIELPIIEFAKLQYLIENHEKYQNLSFLDLLKICSIDELLEECDNIKKQNHINFEKSLIKSIEIFNEFISSRIYALSLFEFEKKMMDCRDTNLFSTIKRHIGPNRGVFYKIILVNKNVNEKILNHVIKKNIDIGIKVFTNRSNDDSPQSFIINPQAISGFYYNNSNFNNINHLIVQQDVGYRNYRNEPISKSCSLPHLNNGYKKLTGFVQNEIDIIGDMKLFLKFLNLERTVAFSSENEDDRKIKNEAIKNIHKDIDYLSNNIGEIPVSAIMPRGFMDAYSRIFNIEKIDGGKKIVNITSLLDPNYDRNISYLKACCEAENRQYYIYHFLENGGHINVIYFSDKEFDDLSDSDREIIKRYADKENFCSFYLKDDSIPPPLFSVTDDGSFGVQEYISGDNIISDFYKAFKTDAKVLRRTFELMKKNAIKINNV